MPKRKIKTNSVLPSLLYVVAVLGIALWIAAIALMTQDHPRAMGMHSDLYPGAILFYQSENTNNDDTTVEQVVSYWVNDDIATVKAHYNDYVPPFHYAENASGYWYITRYMNPTQADVPQRQRVYPITLHETLCDGTQDTCMTLLLATASGDDYPELQAALEDVADADETSRGTLIVYRYTGAK